MLSPKINNFLMKQRARMIELDKAEKIDRDPNVPKFYDETTKQAVSGMTVLYDNCINWLNSAEAADSLFKEFHVLENELTEDTLSTAAPLWTTTALPMIRRLYNSIVARELVSVQPISQPSAFIYWLNTLYTNTHPASGITAGQRTDQQTPTAYSQTTEEGNIRELQMSLERKLVQVTSDKLRADFTLEATQDWKAQYKIDVEGEMTLALSEEIRREVDRRIFNTLIAGAGFTISWDPSGYRSGDQNVSLYRHAYEKEIYNALIDAQSWIMSNARGILQEGGNVEWNVVLSPTNWARFAKMEHWNLTDLSVSTQTGIGRRYVGKINNLFNVYITNEIDDCTIMLTAKSGWLLSPAYFSPYIPLYISPRYITEGDFTRFSKGIMQRSAYGIIPTSGSLGTTSNLIVLINLCAS